METAKPPLRTRTLQNGDDWPTEQMEHHAGPARPPLVRCRLSILQKALPNPLIEVTTLDILTIWYKSIVYRLSVASRV